MRAIVFDGVEIPETLLAREVQNHPGASAADARAAAGHALAIRALLLHRAHELGLEPAPELDDAGREETPEEALVREILDLEVAFAPPTEAECRRVYEANPARFASPALWEVSHILIEPRGTGHDALGAAHDIARRITQTLLEGRATFAELAHDSSDCPSSANGGSLGQLARGDLVPEVDDVLEALDIGQVSDPVLSRFGWHVLRLDRRIAARPLPFEVVRDRIQLHLESRAWTAAATRYVSELAAAARTKGVALTLTEAGAVREGSATLGDFLSDEAAADRLEPWLSVVDPALRDRVTKAAAAAGEEVPDFVRHAMSHFLAEANDERWTNLISAARDAEDPALACLSTVLRSKLAPPRRTLNLSRRAAL